MDNSTLLSLVENLIDNIEWCFGSEDDHYTQFVYEMKKNTNLLEYIKEEDGYKMQNLYAFYLNYQRVKERLELIKALPSTTINKQIPEIKIVNRPSIEELDQMNEDDFPF